MTAVDRRMAPVRSSSCKFLIIVLHANREHRRDAYATSGSATCPATPGRPCHALPHKSPVARKWPINKQSSSHYIHFRNESPVAAVEAVSTVVAQCEIVPGRNSDR